ncbi:DNA/RNA non-specific endonuclease [Coraliomargarita algicola]|uniref:DNA/RNA non-specific endonuclease n=1 Tax=Coraliomargarita algicola TaxID=3092156 RepID=A0ABZ0RK20_9BACT|nr:DNA/RNA non-specific endonuclease [Coraliomargarita sp. J2-16]WPJ96539.1 DNA/RNA non-specific endonuclease [Coraliomargarita sp. J2-16]
MTRGGTIKRRVRQLGLLGRLWRKCKLMLLLFVVATVIFGFWYSKQDEGVQRRSQEIAIAGLDFLIELKQTNGDVDEILNWVISQMPASLGNVVSVGDIEGADCYTFAGVPVSDRPVKILKNEGYLVGYNESLRNPDWVAYRLQRNENVNTSERPESFDVDRRTRARVDHYAYSNSGYDRGHMAPNYAIDMVFGERAQKETFLMSNIVPQRPELNQGPWKELEQMVAKRYLRDYGEVWVLTGPIYDASSRQLSSGVVIPAAFFKIIVDVVEPDGLRALAVIMEQGMDPEGKLAASLVTIDAVEAATGMDFLSALDDSVEAVIEADLAKRLW